MVVLRPDDVIGEVTWALDVSVTDKQQMIKLPIKGTQLKEWMRTEATT